MKDFKRILICLLLIAVFTPLAGCRLHQQALTGSQTPRITLSSEKDVVRFALEAEKRFYGVIFNSNEDYLKKWGFHSSTIKSKEDVEKRLSPYWTEDVANKLWKMGSSQMPDLPFGMYNDDFLDLGLLQAKNLKVTKISGNEWLVSGDVIVADNELTSGYHYTKNVYVIKTPAGWRAKIKFAD